MQTIKFDKKLKCGPDYVAVRILDNAEDIKVGNIYLSKDIAVNSRMALAKVEDSGTEAQKVRGIMPGDYVLIDRLSTYGHTFPVAALRYDNVLAKTDENRTAFRPLLGMLVVEEEKTESKVGQLYVPGYSDKLKTGKVVEANLTPECKIDVKPGDKIILSKKSDLIELEKKTLRCYKEEDLVAVISEGE